MMLNRTGPASSNPLKLEDVEKPVPKAGEVLVRVISVGVCRSNLHMIEGDWLHDGVPSKLPIIPGHEIIGEIADLGDGVNWLKKGQKVGIQPLWSTCGRCEYCLTGRENLCPHKEITGETLDGGYAEYMLGNAMHVYPIPQGIDPDLSSPLFCPGVTAYRAVKRSDLGPGKTAYVMGIGGVGHVVVQIAKLTGSRVVAISTREEHSELAYESGADDVLNPGVKYDRLGDHVRKADSVIVFSPNQDAINAASKLVKAGGNIVLGVHGGMDRISFVDEIQIRGSVIGPRSDMYSVLDLASHGKIRIHSTKYRLSEANEVINLLKKKEIKGRAVLIP
ncbi:alcohol dehydrogenase catalytic domain-containing protein [Oxyplasma meridianum]|uniref:Alcohol dehydrogenase catalytic domain-containing protein n=1 Tax=Oxyplasma meridianum TaxID=3073602 RepID=A0AAX4NIB6_9ARCH